MRYSPALLLAAIVVSLPAAAFSFDDFIYNDYYDAYYGNHSGSYSPHPAESGGYATSAYLQAPPLRTAYTADYGQYRDYTLPYGSPATAAYPFQDYGIDYDFDGIYEMPPGYSGAPNPWW